MCCAQHRTLACLSDVVDYFVARAGSSARPLHVDPATLQPAPPAPPPAPPPARPLPGGMATVGRTPFARQASSTSASAAFSQFVYSNAVNTTTPPPPQDASTTTPPSSYNTASAAAAAAGAGTSPLIAATDNANSMNLRLLTVFTVTDQTFAMNYSYNYGTQTV